jgi:teichuronic acid biosynthesis glycosyltransferase TuaH
VTGAPRVALLSLEPWDDVWRRNQHLCAQLIEQHLAEHILFVEPPAPRPQPPRRPVPGITVLTPQRRLPKRAAGNVVLGRLLRNGPLRRADLLWINDPEVGAAALRSGQPAVYDVTDDWRTAPAPVRAVRRIVRAENRLAGSATTVVCSGVLADRWQERYGVRAAVVTNGIDARAWAHVTPRPLDGAGPHVGYVGTLHAERIDVELTARLAMHPAVGTVHLVGPNVLDAASMARLEAAGTVRVHGPVPSSDVPSWTCAFDVLVCPHVVTPFTMSLDAIKSYEYLASGRPVVATPTSGFQRLTAPQLRVVEPYELVATVAQVLADPPTVVRQDVGSWARRAQEFRATWPL